MEYTVIHHPETCIIGKMGSTRDGDNFIAKLWQEADNHFSEVYPLAIKDANGTPKAVYGAMSDFSLSFRPGENNLSEGLYMAGVECPLDAEAPTGWTKWVLPAFDCVITENKGIPALFETYKDLSSQGMELVYAIQEKNEPATGKQFLLFPIGKEE